MIKKSKHQENLELVLDRIKAASAADSDDRKMYMEMLDAMLDNLGSEDAFGTERQCDPRGDFRNGQWSMKNVEK